MAGSDRSRSIYLCAAVVAAVLRAARAPAWRSWHRRPRRRTCRKWPIKCLPSAPGASRSAAPLWHVVGRHARRIDEKEKVVDVRVVGNQHVKLDKITQEIHTRAGRPFDPQMIEEDVRRLTKTRLFVSVDTTYQHAPRVA